MGKHIRRVEPPTRRQASLGIEILGIIGELLITAAIVIGLFAVWQLYWTTFKVDGPRQEQITAFEEKYSPSTKKVGERRTDEPPPIPPTTPGEIYGIIHVPSWDWSRTPLAEGIAQYTLDLGYAGHYDQTAQPGVLGNFSVAGHRRSHGNNFRWIDRLKQGDKVVVEVADTYYVYSVDNHEIYAASDETNIKVIAPVPGDLTFSQQPSEKWMTMTSCHPEWGNSERYIVHLKFESWTPKSTGMPEELVKAPYA
nr:MAG: class E sortase [Actinomycetota bacterium]